MKVRYFIDLINNEAYKVTDVSVNLSKKSFFGSDTPAPVPENAIKNYYF